MSFSYYYIVAVDKYNGIGKNNTIPWYIKDDFMFFKNVTSHSIVIMGKNTWYSINKKPLKNRHNIVLSSNPSLLKEEYLKHNSKSENISFIHPDNLFSELSFLYKYNKVFFIGGESIYSKYIDKINYLYITTIDKDYNCDRFFPFDRLNLKEVWKTSSRYSDKEDVFYSYKLYSVSN